MRKKREVGSPEFKAGVQRLKGGWEPDVWVSALYLNVMEKPSAYEVVKAIEECMWAASSNLEAFTPTEVIAVLTAGRQMLRLAMK